MAVAGAQRFDFEEDDDFDFDHLSPSRPRGRTNGSKLLTTYLERPSPWARIFRWSIGLLLLAAVGQEAVGLYYDRQMTEVAREVTGRRDVDVRCRRVWDELLNIRANPGFVEWGSTTANLQLPVCRDAAGWRANPGDTENRLGIMVLTHELAHLAGHRDESATECVAMWAVPATAVAFGGTAEEGQLTARWYAAEYNPLLRGDYQAPGCLSGNEPASPLLR